MNEYNMTDNLDDVIEYISQPDLTILIKNKNSSCISFTLKKVDSKHSFYGSTVKDVKRRVAEVTVPFAFTIVRRTEICAMEPRCV